MQQARVSELTVYPVKSCSGLHLNHAVVEEQGLAFDRRFVVCRPNGDKITGRTHPKLAQIHCALTQQGLHLRAPGMEALDIEYQAFSNDYQRVQIWKDEFQGQHCHSDYDAWLSEYLGEAVVLLYYGEQSTRLVKRRQTEVGFADGYPLLLISEASLAELNRRSPVSHRMQQFRPNLVVKGCEAFAEDTWKRIRIGEVEFEITKPCSRCVFTTLDPERGEFNAQSEPLTTLKAFRQGADGELYFGQNLVALNTGKISLYDKIEVLETQRPEAYPDHQQGQLPSSADAMPESTKLWPAEQWLDLPCEARVQEAKDFVSFHFSLPDNLQASYLAGQYMAVEVEIDGHPYHRNYTLSSSPTRPQRLSISVKRVNGGKVSNHLLDTLKPGQSLRCHVPAGDFHWAQSNNQQLLMLAAGSGITPMMSMLRYLHDQQLQRDVVLLYFASTEADLAFKDELDYFAKVMPQLDVRYALTQSTPTNWLGYQGRLNRGMLMDIPELDQRAAYLCGPQGFMQNAKEQIVALGLPEAECFEESFGLRVDSSTPAKTVNILFDSWDTYVEGNDQQSVLEQAEDAGLNLPFSCRGGFCGACKVKLESGEVEVKEDSALTDPERSEGYILACSCIPKTDLTLTQG